MNRKAINLPRPTYLEQVLANAPYKEELTSPSGRKILVVADRPIRDAITDMLRAAMRIEQSVPSILR